LDTKDTGDTKVTMNLRGIDEKLKREFKAICAIEGKSLAEKIQELMKKELEKHRRDKL